MSQTYRVLKTDEYGRSLGEYYINGGWCLNREAADTFTLEEADHLISDLDDYWKTKGYPTRADREFA